jgi:hypothetical protein
VNVRGGADVTFSRTEIVRHHDGIRAYGQSLTAEYVYIHQVAAPNPERHHQDGIQTIAGVSIVERSFIDMTGANTSAMLVKPDGGPIPLARVSETLLMGGQYTISVHDGPRGAPQLVEFEDILVAPGYGRALASIWDFTGEISAEPARVAGSGATVELVDGARL